VDIGKDYQLLSTNLIVHPQEFTKDMTLIGSCLAWLSIERFTFGKMLAADVLIGGWHTSLVRVVKWMRLDNTWGMPSYGF
jgi:hypothetical protein